MNNTKTWFVILIMVFCFSVNSLADEKTELSVDKADRQKQISYALGYDIFKQVGAYFELDPEFFMSGVDDSHSGTPQLAEGKIKELLASYQQLARQKQMEKIKEESSANRALGKKFLEENKHKEGVVTLASGLQYKVLTQGTGPLPNVSDTVECHYKGTLIDGTVFDSSYQRGKPAAFQVNGVIQGWIEALQLMNVGSNWMLYVPPDLAYGDRGAGPDIKPGSTLVFEVELLGIMEK